MLYVFCFWQLRQAKTEIVSASKVAYRFLAGVASNSPESPGKFQGSWFKNLIPNGAKPSSSSELENEEASMNRLQKRQDAETPLRHNSRDDI